MGEIVSSNYFFVEGDKFHYSINESIQLAKYNSVINARLERPKLKNTTYVSPHVQNEIFNPHSHKVSALKHFVDF